MPFERFRVVRGPRRPSFLAVIATAVATMHAAPNVGSTKVDAASDLLAYDQSLPLDVRELDTHKGYDVTFTRLTFAAIDSIQGRVAAHLVRPTRGERFAAVLFVGEMREARPTPQPFVEEATTLATSGIVSLIVDGYTVEQGQPPHPYAARRRVVNYVIDARRGIDLLVRQRGVDVRRVGFVGHDAGAMVGAIVAGIDRRASCYVLMAGTTDTADWTGRHWPLSTSSADEYSRTLTVLNPINYVGIAAPGALLFQFARRDPLVSEAVGAELFDEASQPKEVRWYDSGHDLNVSVAIADRITWLVERLKGP